VNFDTIYHYSLYYFELSDFSFNRKVASKCQFLDHQTHFGLTNPLQARWEQADSELVELLPNAAWIGCS
jgi:hypothetical protein